MKWNIQMLHAAEKNLSSLSGNQHVLVAKAIRKVAENPLSANEGDYGKALGNKNDKKLTKFMKIRLQDASIRIVYTLKRTE